MKEYNFFIISKQCLFGSNEKHNMLLGSFTAFLWCVFDNPSSTTTTATSRTRILCSSPSLCLRWCKWQKISNSFSRLEGTPGFFGNFPLLQLFYHPFISLSLLRDVFKLAWKLASQIPSNPCRKRPNNSYFQRKIICKAFCYQLHTESINKCSTSIYSYLVCWSQIHS